MNDARKYIITHCDGLKILSSYLHLKPAGNLYRCCCPFHVEKTPSFTVYPKGILNKRGEYQEYDTYYCFGCGVSGDVFSFIHKIEGHKSYEETIKYFEDTYKIVYKYSWEQDILEQLSREKPKPIMSLDEINIKASSSCREYLFYIRKNYPDMFEKEFEYIEDFYKKLDNLFYTKPVVELQNTLYDVEKMLINRKKFLQRSKK